MVVTDLPLLGAPADLDEVGRAGWAASVDLGRRAGKGDEDARRALSPSSASTLRPSPGDVVDASGIARFIDQGTFAETVGTNPTYLRRLKSRGRVIEPNVSAGRFSGWSPARVVMWGIEYGYLDGDTLERRALGGGRNEATAAAQLTLEARPHWRFPTVGYLTQRATADFLGITEDSVMQSRIRGTGPAEAIRIGSVEAFDLDRVKIYNRQRLPALRALSKDPGPTMP